MLEKYSEIIVWTILDKKKLKPVDWGEINFEKLLVQASNNRVIYSFVNNLLEANIDLPKEIKNISADIRKEGERHLKTLGNTISFLDKVFKNEKIDYLIVKTFKYLDYVTFDVDFLVRYEDFEKAISALKMNNALVGPHSNPHTQGLHQRNCFKSGYLKMDLHRKFFWLGVEHIDLDFVWSGTTERKIGGVHCPTPSLETDFLLINDQLVYERGYITLLDFLAVKYANEQGLYWDKIMKQVLKYKRNDAFFVLLNWLNYMHQAVFGKDMADIKEYFGEKKYKIKSNELKLPLIYPIRDVMKIFKEVGFRQKRLLPLEFAYYFFTKLRHFTRKRLPFYDHWYDFNKISRKKYTIADFNIGK